MVLTRVSLTWKAVVQPAFLLIAVVLAACSSTPTIPPPSEVPLAKETLALLAKKGMQPGSPVFVRIFKEESELEIWKQRDDGRFYHFKTYPICNWSGEIGPKLSYGDRQAPEGFYTITPALMNPNSKYYLSFNVGYPNAYDKSWGRTGDSVMVHGSCKSAGCYAMTDQGVGEIYAIVQKALEGGQERFQVQAYPFRMTTQNMASHKGDPNMPFWRTLKEGYDAFAFTRLQPKVSVCSGRYVFNKEFTGGEPSDPLAQCPATVDGADNDLMAKIGAEQKKLDAAFAGAAPVSSFSYSDGGMHPSFRSLLKQEGAKGMAARISRTK